jgi:hypothetical protein
MLKLETVEIKTAGCRKLKYFELLGYDTTKDFFLVKISDLNKGSRIIIDVICDYCNSENKISYKDYYKNISNIGKYACSKKCGSLKAKETCLNKWGVENAMCLKETQEKTKKTNLKRYGVEYLQQSEEFKEKSKETLLKNWGVDHISKTEEFKEKSKKWMSSDEFKEKSKETLLKNWGVDNPSKSQEIIKKVKNKKSEFLSEKWTNIEEKIKKTKLEKYGDENYNNKSKQKETLLTFDNEKWLSIKNKRKKTKLENWDDENYNNSEKIKESLSLLDWHNVTKKRKETNLLLWGDENYNNSEKIKEYFNNLTKEEKELILDKSKKTKLEKWGDENYNNPEKIKESLSKIDWEKVVEKRKETIYDKYGTDIFKNEIFRKSNYEIAKDSNYLEYLNNNISLFNCLSCGNNFEISTDNYYSRKRTNIPLCTVCNPIGDSQSIKEKQLFEFISSIYNGEIIKSYRNGLEIDIYLPDLKLGFEFNGLYWHSDKYRNKNYHLDKTNHFKERGIRIIHIWEDDWVYKRDIMESQIKNWLGLTECKIFARKCRVREIKNSKIVTKFLEENHIQGRVNSNLKLGLYYDEELVSLITFDHYEGRKKMEYGGWNINRFCNKLNSNVIGGASKLFKYFLNNYDTKRVISYSDSDWSLGNLYKNLGFIQKSDNKPDYKYIIDGKRVHKSRFRKSKTGISENKLKILKIFDCGKIKWEYLK